MANLNLYRFTGYVTVDGYATVNFYAPSGYILLVTSRSAFLDSWYDGDFIEFFNCENAPSSSFVLRVAGRYPRAYTGDKIAISDTYGISILFHSDHYWSVVGSYTIIGYLL